MENENEKDESYNGWGNYESWKVALNIDNEEWLYNESRHLIRSWRIRDGEALKSWFLGIAQQENGVYKFGYDEWTESEFNKIDFDEIFASFNKEIEQEIEEEQNSENEERENEANIKYQLEQEQENHKENERGND